MDERNKIMIVSGSENNLKYFEALVKKNFDRTLIYVAQDYSEALYKISNDTPAVVLVDADLNTPNAFLTAHKILGHRFSDKFVVVIASTVPDKDEFVEEVINGKVRFLTQAYDENQFCDVIKRSFNFASGQNPSLLFDITELANGEYLYKEGEVAQEAYILKKGLLGVYKDKEGHLEALADIQEGEFVGALGYLTGTQIRPITVIAKARCELIRIKYENLDALLMTKPAWARALALSLSKRLSDTIKKIEDI